MKNDTLFLFILSFGILIIFWYLYNIEEDYDYAADYDKGIINGRIVSGTVYDSNPPGENTGLGWVL